MQGQTVSHYRIVSRLGAGGMGVVYSAEDLRLGRLVALKFVPEDLAQDSQAVERLRAEARAASALNHANICTIYDIGEHEKRPFIVMELMKGQTLKERLTAGPIKISQLVDIGIQVADALDAAHSQGIVHRDIKPANLFLTDRGQVKILDFGLAKLSHKGDGGVTTTGTPPVTADQLTPEGVAVGTVSYMSPEQATGEDLDGRTDLFSLGIVLYECATGHRPFTGKTSAVILSAILNRAPVAPVVLNPELPLRLQEVIANCLEKDPELRYQEASSLRADLRRVKRDLESGQSGIVTLPSASDPLRPMKIGSGSTAPHLSETYPPATANVRRGNNRFGMGATAAIVVAIALLGAYTLWWPPMTPPSGSELTIESAALVENRLGLATTSLQRRDYRAALGYANEVLQAAPGHARATEIRDNARAAIAELDDAIAETQRLLGARDVEGASVTLERARSLDPTAPQLADLSAQLVQLRSDLRTTPATRQTPATSPQRSSPPAAQQRTASAPTSREPGVVTPESRTPEPPPAPQSARSSTPPSTQAVAPPSPASSMPASPPAAVSTPSPVISAAPPAAAAPQTQATPAAQTPPAPIEPPAARSDLPPVVGANPPEPAPRTTEPATASKPAAQPEPRTRNQAPSTEDDEAAIRRVVGTYARAIETRDLALFRSVKPNLSAEEERRLGETFRAGSSEQVTIRILAIELKGSRATVRLRRQDTLPLPGGRSQTSEVEQSLTLIRTGSTWIIDQIGR